MPTPELPTGTVTFLFSDIEGSTRLLQELGDSYFDVLQRHHQHLRQAITDNDGVEVSTEGDSFFVVFPNHLGAIRAAAQAQRSLADQAFPQPVRVRMGLHTGQGRLSGDNYVGLDVHRTARIAAAGHGGAASKSWTLAADQAWNAAHRAKPDPDSFRKEILPVIQSVPLRQLAEATGLSISHCGQVRRGKKVPHPRHWQALREAAGQESGAN